MFAYKKINNANIDHENGDLIEKDYDVIGITGVEDLLQDNVRTCI